MRSWSESRFQKSTHLSGGRFENEVVNMIHKYTDAVWRNVRIETLLTQTGMTEIDILFFSEGIVYVLELKRVRRIVGEYGKQRWLMYGWQNRSAESSEYTALNVIEQNNIHARSLSDLYYSEFCCFPTILPVIIVPNDCVVPQSLKRDVFTVTELEDFIMAHRVFCAENVAYRVSFLLNTTEGLIKRRDFVSRGMRDGEPLRGKLKVP